jgi:multidrug resistance efflux pump
VSAACLTVQSFDARLEEAVAAVRSLEERTIGLARLVSTAQQYAEQQGAAQREAAGELGRRLRGVEARLDEVERPGQASEWEERLRAGGLPWLHGDLLATRHSAAASRLQWK